MRTLRSLAQAHLANFAPVAPVAQAAHVAHAAVVALAALGAFSGMGCASAAQPTDSSVAVVPAGAGSSGGSAVNETPSTGGSSGSSGSSGSDAGPAPLPPDGTNYATPVQCSSAAHWTGGNKGSASMQPGSACRSCHVLGGSASGKSWDISGTVYATAHEPNDCNGVGLSGVTVEITDAKGTTTSLPVNSVGNFWHNDFFGFAAIAKPYTAKVVYNGKSRAMIGAQTDGDCNKCHSEAGASLAPGRIMLP
jgi:hypothetical protein